jgi:putative N6-adenine-specific DNA methylase
VPARPRVTILVTCLPGLERLLAEELTTLGVRPGRPRDAGVPCAVTLRQLYALNARSRLAERVLVQIDAFVARTFADLERHLGTVDWDAWREPGAPVVVRVRSQRSRLFHTAAVAERVHRVAGAPPATDAERDEATSFRVDIDHDRVTVRADSSGEPLHRRGWRVETAKAPLRETLAAAMLAAAGWEGRRPLVDPFCGSGTIPIEAATIARDLAPGRARSFAFARWPSFAPGTWASVAGEVAAAERTALRAGVAIAGRDRDDGAIGTAARNAVRAGVGDDLDLTRASLSDLGPVGDGPGWVITNSPYGARVGGGDLRDLFARLGDVVRSELPGWSVGVLVADAQVAAAARLPWREAFRTTNGGIPVRFLVAEAVSTAASARPGDVNRPGPRP